MLISQSRVLSCVRYLQIGQSKNLSRNASNSPKLFRCSSGDKFKNEVPNKIFKEHNVAEEQSFNKTGYSAQLENNVCSKENTNVEKCTNLTKAHNNLEQSNDVQFLKEYKYNYDDALEDIDEKLPGPLDSCTEDLSYIGPNIEPTYNFAKFADRSNTIQQLVKLGVKLYILERNPEVIKLFLSLDFDKNIAPYLRFLHTCGINVTSFGDFITKYPTIFNEDMDDLSTRIRYLRAHSFTSTMITQIIDRHPPWLSFQTKEIDRRLSYFQKTFSLHRGQIMALSIKLPKLITYDMGRIIRTTFSLKEEMGFNLEEIQRLLLTTPRVWIRARSEVMKTFDYLHNNINFSHTLLSGQGMVLLCRRNRLESRHKFLVELGRNQYDPEKPLYVSPQMLTLDNDIFFCKNVAKCSVNTYNAFLKSL